MLNGRSNLAFIPTAFISGEGRYYYNFLKRLEKGKSISRNSANYIGVPVNYGLSLQTFYIEDGSRIRTTTQVYNFGIVGDCKGTIRIVLVLTSILVRVSLQL